jgi:hypothetical protein
LTTTTSTTSTSTSTSTTPPPLSPFSDGFESGDLSNWDGYGDGSIINENESYGGDYAYNGSAIYSYPYADKYVAFNEIYVSFMAYFPVPILMNVYGILDLLFYITNDNNSVSFYVGRTNAYRYIMINSSDPTYCKIEPRTWYRVSIHVYNDGGDWAAAFTLGDYSMIYGLDTPNPPWYTKYELVGGTYS